jgi:ribose transport system ATP-binding protein
VLELRGVNKSFPGVKALKNVDFTLKPGEVHCLIGENGAGKSTLIRIISGAHSLDSGEIYFQGQLVSELDAHRARQLGVSVIYQEMNLIPQLSVAENIFLGNEPTSTRLGFVQEKRLMEKTQEILQKIGVSIHPHKLVRDLSTAEQQMVEIAKALALDKEILIMDEPTASLTAQNTEDLFRIIRRLTKRGVSVIYISHRLQELSIIADRVTVLRDGAHISTFAWGKVTTPELITMMVGREVQPVVMSKNRQIGQECVLEVKGLRKEPLIKEVTFRAYKGEIVCFAGLVGSGRTETMRLIFGADQRDSGQIFLYGKELRLRSPADAVRDGIGMLTEDRKGQGLVLGLPVRDNMTLASLATFSKWGRINRAYEGQVVDEQVRALDIVTPSIEHLARNLSGGNQQKVVLAKWLLTESKVLIFDEPTRGVDVGAKEEIYEIMRFLAQQGVTILMVSSDLPEVLRMGDRIIVMSEGRITGELSRDEATQEKLMALMLGGVANAG